MFTYYIRKGIIANSITSSIDLRLTNHNHYHIQPVSERVCAIGSYPITSRPSSKTTKSYAGLFLPATFTNHSEFVSYRCFPINFQLNFFVVAFCYSYFDLILYTDFHQFHSKTPWWLSN